MVLAARRCGRRGQPRYAGSRASAAAFDKVRAKLAVGAVGVPVLPSLLLEHHKPIDIDLLKAWRALHGALIAKPVADG